MSNETPVNISCEEASSAEYDLGLHIAAIFVTFASATIGVFIPILLAHFPKLHWTNHFLLWSKFFGAGVILCTGVVHIFPEAVETLSNECLPVWFYDYPSAGLFALLAVFAMQVIEWLVVYVTRDKDAEHTKEGMEPESDEHSHSLLLREEQHRHNISTYSLEIGIMVHSVIIGVSLGLAREEFTALFIALCFHQCFEGVGLGSMIAKVNFKYYCVAYWNGFFYALTTPIGVAIGIGVTYGAADPQSSLLAIGIFESFAAGILIYSSLVNIISRSYHSQQFFVLPTWEKVVCFFAFYVGAAAMAVLAIWA